MLKAASYARFSSDRQREESVEAQLRDNKKYALKNNLSVVKEYVDRAETGRATENREEFQRMIQDSKDGKFDVIIVHKVDRFARNRYESAIYKHNLKKHGVKVAYSAQAIDDSPEGVLMEGMLESFAEYYSLNLGVEVMKGLKENALKAQFNGGTPPLGYDVDENKHYIINEKESRIVDEIFRLYLAGSGYKEIARILNSKGYKNKFGKPFVYNSIPGILKNEKYMGIYTFNKTKRTYGDNGKRNIKVQNSENDIIRLENALPILIPKEVFRMTQEELTRRAGDRGKSKSVREYLLSGLVKCKKCSGRMNGYSQKRVKDGDRYFYYRCSSCSNSIRAEYLEQNVMEELNNLVFANLDDLMDKMHVYIENAEKEAPEELKYLNKELESTNKEIDNIVNMITKGVGSLELGKRLEGLEEYRESVEDRIRIVSVKAQVPEKELRAWLMGFKSDFDKGENLKQTLARFIDEVRVDKEEYEIDFFIRAPQDGASRLSVEPSAPLKKYSSLELYFFLCPLLHVSVVFNIPKVFIVGFSKYVTVGSHYVVVIAVVFRVQGCLN